MLAGGRRSRGARVRAWQDPLVSFVDPSMPPPLSFVFFVSFVAVFAPQCLNRSDCFNCSRTLALEPDHAGAFEDEPDAGKKEADARDLTERLLPGDGADEDKRGEIDRGAREKCPKVVERFRD